MGAGSEADLLRELVNVYCAITGTKKEFVRDQVDLGAQAENRWSYFTRKKNPLQSLKPREAASLYSFFRANFDQRFYFYLLSNYPEATKSIFGEYSESARDRKDRPSLPDVRDRQAQFFREFTSLMELGDQESSRRKFSGRFIGYRHEVSGRLITSLVTIKPFEPYAKAAEVVAIRGALDMNEGTVITFRGLFFGSIYGFQMLGLPAPNKGLWLVNFSPVGETEHPDLYGILSILSDETSRPLATKVYFARVVDEVPDTDELRQRVDSAADQPGQLDSILMNTKWRHIEEKLYSEVGFITT